MMTKINHRVRVDSHVTVSVSKLDHEETCTLETPTGIVKNLNEVDMKGVRAYGGTMFATCGVDIGPINDVSLLGTWTLCSEYSELDYKRKRCQPAIIEYSWCPFF